MLKTEKVSHRITELIQVTKARAAQSSLLPLMTQDLMFSSHWQWFERYTIRSVAFTYSQGNCYCLPKPSGTSGYTTC